MDALGAFAHLQTNLPAWITRVSELAAHTAARHNEYAEAYRRHATAKPKSRRHKSSSVCSIHTDDVIPLSEQKTPGAEEPAEVGTSTSKDANKPAQAGRKRGTDEAPSIDSGDRHTFFSTRHNVIIDYDGHTQKELETVVRDISLARNHIRRGKMTLAGRGSVRTNILNKSVNLGTRVESSPLPALSRVRSTRTGSAMVGVTTGSVTGVRKDTPFEFADKQLEVAHGLCETAAYQVLRSGDCATELDGVEEKFKMLLDMANNEVTRLEQEKKEEEEKERAKKEAAGEQEQDSEPSSEDVLSKPPVGAAARLARLSAFTNSKPMNTAPGTIEVDDGSSISAESIDLSAIRSTRIRV